MTENLHAKFAGFQDQIATEHTEIMNALDAIATALGAPPPGPTTTLEDVVTAIIATNALLTGIRSDQASQAAALLTVANAIYSNTELMIENASTNTQALISAIYSTYCACESETPVLPPPIDVTPTPLLEDEKCKRIQFYMAVFTTWLGKLANYTAAGASITSGVIESLLTLAATEAGIIATGAEVGAVGGPPGVILVSIGAAIAGAVYLFGSAILNDYLADFQSPIFQHALLEALYAANTADEGQSAFESVVGTYFAAIPASILSALWWTSWSNDIYSGVPEVDDSAFDGSICAPEDGELVMVVPTVGCNSAHSVLATMGDSTTLQAIDWNPGTTSNFVDSGTTQTSDKRVWGLTDLFGLWVSSVPNCHAYLDATGFPNIEISSTPQQITVHTTNRYSFVTASLEFVLTICVDEP